ncbi:hypothetical protein U5B43_07360 [Campylobacter sp. 9BO]|uniref:hypothetical protein n=1 Tax=Campylobacter sp. 9BO TaxID=3424759 RepID=UPI003D3492E8
MRYQKCLPEPIISAFYFSNAVMHGQNFTGNALSNALLIGNYSNDFKIKRNEMQHKYGLDIVF